jgi:hypothetical protein
MSSRFVPALQLCFFVIGALAFIAPNLANAQQSSVNPVKAAAMPDQRFYALAFRHILFLEDVATPSSDPSVPSTSLADYYGHRVGATQAEQIELIAAARDWQAKVTPVDTEAHGIIDAIHAATPGGRLGPNQSPPTVPQQLITLQAQKDKITLDHVASLHAAMGDDRFKEVDDQLHRTTRVTHRGPMPTQAQR